MTSSVRTKVFATLRVQQNELERLRTENDHSVSKDIRRPIPFVDASTIWTTDDRDCTEITMSNKFPGKLWQIVNDCKSGAISWGQSGQTIVVHHTKFQEEFLDPTNSLFKTKNIGSFIRQLNLYGFRKLNALRFANSGAELREIHEFQNDYFVRDRAHLLSRLRRNVGIRRSREAAVEKRLDEIHGYTAKRRHLLEVSFINKRIGLRYMDSLLLIIQGFLQARFTGRYSPQKNFY